MTWPARAASNLHAIDVRAIDVDEWPIWRDLRLQALTEAPYAFGSTLAEWQGEGDTEVRWRARLDAVRINFVAYLNGKCAGMASGTAADRDETIELISMWVAPFARGKGVGDSLIAAIVAWARERRAAKIALAVVESNRHALNLYSRHRFVDAGAVDGTDPGAAVERLMILDLDAHEAGDERASR